MMATATTCMANKKTDLVGNKHRTASTPCMDGNHSTSESTLTVNHNFDNEDKDPSSQSSLLARSNSQFLQDRTAAYWYDIIMNAATGTPRETTSATSDETSPLFSFLLPNGNALNSMDGYMILVGMLMLIIGFMARRKLHARWRQHNIKQSHDDDDDDDDDDKQSQSNSHAAALAMKRTLLLQGRRSVYDVESPANSSHGDDDETEDWQALLISAIPSANGLESFHAGEASL